MARVTGLGNVTGQSFLLFYPRGWSEGGGQHIVPSLRDTSVAPSLQRVETVLSVGHWGWTLLPDLCSQARPRLAPPSDVVCLAPESENPL